jgi:hypothetical protein
MIRVKFALLGILLLIVSAARADLDLTPSVVLKSVDGVKVSYVTFHDNDKVITYTPPHGWTLSGSHGGASLSIPDHSQARVTIQSAPRLRVPSFDDKAAKFIHDNPGVLQLPRGAKNIMLTALTPNPLVIDGHNTLDVQVTYSFFGQSCAKSILLVDRKGAEVSFVVDCLAPEFSNLVTQFHRSLYSIENL